MAIMRDTTLTEDEKCQKRQEVMMGGGKWAAKESPAKRDGKGEFDLTQFEKLQGPVAQFKSRLEQASAVCSGCVLACESTN
jgi:hypothetical protein